MRDEILLLFSADYMPSSVVDPVADVLIFCYIGFYLQFFYFLSHCIHFLIDVVDLASEHTTLIKRIFLGKECALVQMMLHFFDESVQILIL